MKECGEPKLQVVQKENDDGSISFTTTDENKTIEKMKERLPDFIQKYSGNDLTEEVNEYVEKEYVKKVKAAIRKEENIQHRLEEDAKGVEDFDWGRLITSSTLDSLKVSQLDLYLTEIIGMTRAQTRRAGYKKSNKIMDITAHFYTNNGRIYTREASATLNLSV